VTAASSPLRSNVQTVPWWCTAKVVTLYKQCKCVKNVIDFCIKLVIKPIIRELELERERANWILMCLGRGRRRLRTPVKWKKKRRRLQEARRCPMRCWSHIEARLGRWEWEIYRLCRIRQGIRLNWELGRRLIGFKQVFRMQIWGNRSLYWSVMYFKILEAEKNG